MARGDDLPPCECDTDCGDDLGVRCGIRRGCELQRAIMQAARDKAEIEATIARLGFRSPVEAIRKLAELMGR